MPGARRERTLTPYAGRRCTAVTSVSNAGEEWAQAMSYTVCAMTLKTWLESLMRVTGGWPSRGAAGTRPSKALSEDESRTS